MSPMRSTDRCMTADLYAGTDTPCTRPSYWTVKPLLRLCAECFRARFGCDPQDNLVPGVQRAADDSRRVPTRFNAQGVEDTGRDGGPPAPNRQAAA